MNPQTLMEAAAAAAEKAYAPYSNYQVGAALQCSDGHVITGCNVENASYGLTTCAERTAVFSAIAAGRRDFVAIAVVTKGEGMPFPCGACRQVLSEFCRDEMPVYVARVEEPENYEVLSFSELLPHRFKNCRV